MSFLLALDNASVYSWCGMRRLLGVLALCVAAGSARAQSADAVLDLLLRKGLITTQEVREAKEKMDADLARAVEQYHKKNAPKWIEQLAVSGDFRLRADYISPEENLNQADTLRYRMRLRLGVDTEFNDWASLGLRFVSGDADPVSANQTFTDTFRKKPISIDMVYVNLQLPHSDAMRVLGGKMPIPIWQPRFASPMVYDPDVTPEGLAEQFHLKFGDNQQYQLFANFGQFAVKEFSADANDTYLFDFEGGAQAQGRHVGATIAGGYYLTHNLDRLPVGDSPNLGNAVAVSGASTNFLADFNVVYGRAELAWTIRDQPFLGTPCLLTFSGEYLKNLAGAYDSLSGATTNISPDQTAAWQVQVVFGDAKTKGQWQLIYAYKLVEADATWDAIADSDFGRGGTDRRGHLARVAYNLQDWWQIGVNAGITEKITRRPNSGHDTVGVAGENLLRLQTDSTFKF